MTLMIDDQRVALRRKRIRILICGTVQGVGFRPFAHRQANRLGLDGWVGNSARGVTIEVQGQQDRLDEFVATLRGPLPANAEIEQLDIEELALQDENAFVVRQSETSGGRGAQVVPDLTVCEQCLRELFDPGNRRYRYPFISCTHCGPRYSIVESLPYDRSRTTMRAFRMCTACRQEYEDPADRRFHAQPNACAECGPQIALWDHSGNILAQRNDALLAAAVALRQGQCVAVKGIGGFHLMVDAGNEAAVHRLRLAKGRDEKPFAVMCATLEEARVLCQVSAAEAQLLADRARPIVLLRKAGKALAPSVAPGNARLGVMLPYSPLHHLLLHELGIAVVATSGNVSDEPIVSDEHDALVRLSGLAGLFLVHDRQIVRPLDDSVAQVVLGEPQLLRRARGYAPGTVSPEKRDNGILAFGSHLKSTIALTCEAGTVLSHHLGDLDTVAARDAYSNASAELVRLFSSQPQLAVCDMHPEYASTHAAEKSGLPVVAVQHHVAHVAACMADNGLAPPVLGVAWDGVGYGDDGTSWGGEFIAIDESGWRRVAHLRPFPLPGGDAVAREPARAALGLLYAVFGEEGLAMVDLPPVARFGSGERKVLLGMLRRGINSPMTSSAGRLFDAFAALCGLRQRSSYEGQAAAEFEWCAQAHADHNDPLPLRIRSDAYLVVDWEPALVAAISGVRAHRSAADISASLHVGLASAIAQVAKRLGARRIALTGGCFQNILLTEKTVSALRAIGCEPFWHRRVPPNDGGIAYGQAEWAARPSVRSEQRGQT